ncbi:MAG TPA: transglycosylase SLT domain-containing protein, partial [Clostridia bacterium]|nr:transglycosylase SLT domain-containing protein [Clostridia bacterium]
MKRRIISILLICILIFGVIGIGFCEGRNLSKKEVEEIIKKVAIKRGIPSVILKSIAKIESSFNQFNRDGRPLTSRGGHIGIMQISGRDGNYSLERLKRDPVYNIEAGADHLLGKWKTANEKMAQIGNMDPNILEHWYFALWAYNGLIDRNNPNANTKTYQERVYEVAKKDYGVKITPVSRGSIPKRGWPKNNIKIDTPENHNKGDILKYSLDDKVKVDGKDFLVLYDKPRGKEIGRVKGNLTMTIIEGPAL